MQHMIVDKDGFAVRLGSAPEGAWYSKDACRDEVVRLNREGLPEFAPYSMVRVTPQAAAGLSSKPQPSTKGLQSLLP